MASVQQLIRHFNQQIGGNSAANLKTEYTNRIRPAFVHRYGGRNLPAQLYVDEDQDTFDGGGLPGMVQVNLGVAKYPIACIRTFAVAHETGHAVVPIEFQRVGVPIFDPYGGNGTRMKLHEHMADLIAMRVLQEYLPEVAAEVIRNLGVLAQALGPGTPLTHPSGRVRTDLIRRLYHGQPFGHLFAVLANQQLP